ERGAAPTLARLSAAAGPGGLDARTVAEAETAGDPAAGAIMERARQAFAAALVGIVDVLTPRRIVVGGSLAQGQGERLLAPARERVAREAFGRPAARVSIVPAALGDDVGLAGAIPLLAGALQVLAGRAPLMALAELGRPVT
ncbi:MAG: ROK family protein, partial [Candidatus Limnocylindrales bacterium]